MDHDKGGLQEGMDRAEFLKTLGVAGLGAAGMGMMMGAGLARAADEKPRYLVVITHGGNNPNRAVWALLMADTILKKGLGSCHVWVTMEGADLARKGSAERITSPIFEKFGSAAEVMGSIKKQGGTFGICPPCADFFALGKDKLDFFENQGGDFLMKSLPGASVVWM